MTGMCRKDPLFSPVEVTIQNRKVEVICTRFVPDLGETLNSQPEGGAFGYLAKKNLRETKSRLNRQGNVFELYS